MLKIRLPVGAWGWLHVLPIIATMLLAVTLPTWLSDQLLHDAAPSLSASSAPVLEIVKFALFVLLAIIGVALVDRKWPTRDAFGLGEWNVRDTVLLAVVAFGLLEMVVWVLEETVPGARAASAEVRESLGIGKSRFVDAMLVLTITVAAPVGEEFLCRGLVFRVARDALARTFKGLPRWLPLLAATLASSYFFMSLHGGGGQNVQIYMIGLLGLICALAYAITGSLRAAVLIHSLNNGYAMLEMTAFCVDPKLMWVLAFVGPALSLLVCDALERVLRK